MATTQEEGVSSASASSVEDKAEKKDHEEIELDDRDKAEEKDREEVELDDGFPEGMRVMAIDSDDVCLNVLVSLLRKCKYQVTAHTKATEALEELRRDRDTHQIVITCILGLDMDWTELLETVSQEMDIPIVVVSASEDTTNIMLAVLHGAQDYLLKPVREEVLRNIWQHVVRKKIQSRIEERRDKLLKKRLAPTAGGEAASRL